MGSSGGYFDGSNEVTELGSSDYSLEVTRYGILEGLKLGLSLESTDGEGLGSDEGIIIGSTDGEVLGSTLGPTDGITLRSDEGTDLDYSDGSSDGSNKVKPEGSLLGY